MTLDATNSGATYSWNTGATTATLEVTQSGTYTVDVDLNGCVASDEIQVTFKPAPQIELGPDRRPCESETVNLDGSSANGADSYQWNTGATSPGIQITQSGTYWIDATLDGCTRRDSVEINYIILPEEVLGTDVQSCDGETVTLDATVPYGDAVYQWNTGATSARLEVTQSGNYSVDIQVAQCRTSDEVTVTFNPVPDFELGSDAFLCEGETYDLFISVTGDSYRWSDGSTKDELTVTYPGGLVWGEVTLDGCTFRDSVRIDYQDAPQVNLPADTAICAERPLRLSAGSVSGAIIWSTGETQRSIQVATSGTYWVEVQDGVCTVRDSVNIDIRDCVFLQTYTPNAFSPDNDGINDTFRPFLPAGIQINSYRFAVFDRWGNQVFETSNPDDSWDGTARGQQLPQGVFVYFLELDFVDDDGADEIIESGDVMLIK